MDIDVIEGRFVDIDVIEGPFCRDDNRFVSKTYMVWIRRNHMLEKERAHETAYVLMGSVALPSHAISCSSK